MTARLVFMMFALCLGKEYCSISVYSPQQCNIQDRPSMLYFIRHAQSLYNAVDSQMEQKYGPDAYLDEAQYISQKFSPEYYDVDIAPQGKEAAEQAKKKMAEIDVDLVIVSPMRRALATCDIIFEGHKNKPPIIVEPAFREIMESSNDIGTKLEESIKMYPNFNFQHIKDKQAWYVHTLHNQKDRDQLLGKLYGLQGNERKEKATQYTLELMKENWAERRNNLEFEQALKVRVLPDYNEQLKVLEKYMDKYKHIAIVAHSECIKLYAGYKIKNCQIFQTEASKLKTTQQV